MKYILPFCVVSHVHNSTTVISVVEIGIPQGKLYSNNSRQEHKQSILEPPGSRSKRILLVLLRNRCPANTLCSKNSHTSPQTLNLCLILINMASSEPVDTSQTNHTVLRVAYDYEYDYKTRKVSVRQGELLHLLQKTNEHWWKVMRPGINKPFFVPAQYVTPVTEDEDEEKLIQRLRAESISANSAKSFSSSNQSITCSPSNSAINNNNNQSPSSDKDGSIRKALATRTFSSESSYFKASSNSKSSKINRNEATRASHRDRANSKLSSSSTKISSSLGKLKNWSASLEELSKQIVFPGLTSESVADLTAVTRGSEAKYLSVRDKKFSLGNGNSRSQKSSGGDIDEGDESKSELINKCLSFRNPSFNRPAESKNEQPKLEKESSSSYLPRTSTESLHQQNHQGVRSMEYYVSRSGTMTKTSKPPPIPSSSSSPIRILPDNWAEYYSPEFERYFYYNGRMNVTSWKPPRNSSNKKSDEHLGSSLSDASAHASSFERSLENIPDFVCSTNTSLEVSGHEASSYSVSDYVNNTGTLKESSHESRNLSMESVTSSKIQQSEDEGNPVDVFAANNIAIPVPDGWETRWDDASQQICYINKLTGAKWFTSTDSQERIYFYEENSSNSSWFLPVPGATVQSHSSASKSLATDSPDEGEALAAVLDASKYGSVKKRHSAGEVPDRSQKSKSLLISTDLKKFSKTDSLPRPVKTSIWSNGRLNILREGPLARTKITENGKKLRKSWGSVYAVLTESHLSLYKDQKSFTSTLTKTEVEIELEGATVEWTEEKSSRKNVFQLNTSSDLQMLFQVDDKELAGQWFEDIKIVTEKSDFVQDAPMRLRSTESPDNLLDPPIGERKISSRLSRNKSTKLRITSTSEDSGEKNKIRAHLKKFFNRRPPRESLVKKGIYKDESVFGCSLEKLCALEKRDVPRFVEECIVAIESKAENLKTDGIYRASGNLSQVQKIRLQVDQNNMACLIQEEDVHVLAGCLKLFFRELKEPLIPYDLFEKALLACHAQNKKEKIGKFRDIVHHLAKPNKCTLQALLSHLLKVAAFSEFNRMQIPNLAIVFGPTLMWPAIESQNMALELMQQNLVIEALLVEYDSIFQ